MRRGEAGSRWQGLLVSVRSATEATAALEGGAAIIDVKEPNAGALGAAAAVTAAAVGGVVGERTPWTVACGELATGQAAQHVEAVLRALPDRARLPAAAKAGPAGLAAGAWAESWRAFAEALPAGVAPVAVAYADWQVAGCLPPEVVIAAAAETPRCGAVLIDTSAKDGPGVLDLVPPLVLRRWLATARSAGLPTALAGRLTGDALATAAAAGPDVVAVRSAVCRGGRLGVVCRDLVAAARAQIDTPRSAVGMLAEASREGPAVLISETPR